MSTYDLIKIERRVDLPFKRSVIHQDIIYICNNSIRYFLLVDIENLNTITAYAHLGLVVGEPTIEVKLIQIDENNTSLEIKCYMEYASKAYLGVIEKTTSEFLEMLSMKLEGENVLDKETPVKTSNNLGCTWIFILVILAIIITSFFIFNNK